MYGAKKLPRKTMHVHSAICFPPHLIDFQVGCPDQVLLVLGSRDVVEDVVKGPGDDAHQFWTGLDACKATTELLMLWRILQIRLLRRPHHRHCPS